MRSKVENYTLYFNPKKKKTIHYKKYLRFCGRSVISNYYYFCVGQSLNTSFVSAYLDSLGGSKFTSGANFAVAGSATLPKFVPFSLNIQLMQFLHYKARTLELVTAGNFTFYFAFTLSLYLLYT